jgi:hypothetical protein
MDINRFDTNRFEVSGKFDGQPLNLGNVTRTPYDGLDSISGCSDADPEIAAVGDKTRELHNKLLGITLVTEKPIGEYNIGDDLWSAIEGMRPRFSRDSLFLIGDQEGKGVFQSKFGFDIVQSIGGCDDDMNSALSDRKNMALDLVDQHLDDLCGILDCPERSLIIEMGAGVDYERMRRLFDYAQSRKGSLICHDPAPFAAKKAGENTPEIPYLAIPGVSDFLSLPLADVKRPKVITMKNVVSSLAFGQIDDVSRLAGNIGAQKIVVSQSLNIANGSNMIPEGWRSGERDNKLYMATNSLRFLPALCSNQKEAVVAVAVMALQASHITNLIMMELARRRMAMGVKAFAKMDKSRTVLVKKSKMLDATQSLDYLKVFSPERVGDFESGNFSSIEVGPFGCRAVKDLSVNKGSLNLVNLQYHWEFSRLPMSNPKSGENSGDVRVLSGEEIMVPRRYVWQDQGNVSTDLKGQLPGCEGLVDIMSPEKFAQCSGVGGEIAFSMIFNKWGREFGHQGIEPFLGTEVEKKLHERFVKGN